MQVPALPFPAIGGGGGGGGAPAPTECEAGFTLVDDACVALSEIAEEGLSDANDGITSLDEGSTLGEIEAAVDDLAGAGDDIAGLLETGDADPELGLDFVNSATTAVDTVSGLADADPDAAAETMGKLLSTIGTVSGSLDPAALSAQQLTALNTDIAGAIDSVTGLVAEPGDLSDEAKDTLIAAAEDLLAGSISANGGALDAQNKAALVALLDSLEEEDPFAGLVIEIPTDDLAIGLSQTLLDEEAALAASVDSEGRVSFSTFSDFSGLTAGTNATGSEFANLELGVDFVADIASLKIVSSSVADGFFELSNGNVLIVGDNLSMTLSPASFDIESFVDAATAANVDVTLLPNGGLSISDGVIVALATFGFENAENADLGNSGTATFGGVTGADESDANYFFTVNYANGATQKLQPLISDDAFYDSVEGFGYAVSTDRATGIITIDGVGNFRPGYVVNSITFAEGFTHNLNKDASGVSYAVTDANSDGVMDVLVFTDSSVQIVFGMP